MNRFHPRYIAAAMAIELALSGLTMRANAQQPQEQQQRQDDRRDQQREQGMRAQQSDERRMSDSRRIQALSERKRWMEQRKRKPIIGVLLFADEQAGVRIAGVTPDSAAASAGLQAGDRIFKIDGARVLGSSGVLRVENARKLLGKLDDTTPVRIAYMRNGKATVATVTPKMGERVVMLPGGAGESKRIRIVGDGDEHVHVIDMDHPRDLVAPHAASEIRKEIVRIGPGGGCKGPNCRTPRLLSAFRWNGLNLASLDPQLGRYFGTDKGVLVLSTGALEGLQSGDVIQSVDGRQVDSPREVMDALRDKPANARVAVGYMRDRKTARTTVTVPEMLRDIPMPPAPPAPPRPPSTPGAPAPPAPPAPPTTPSAAHLRAPSAHPAAIEAQYFVFTSDDRKQRSPSMDDEEGAPRVIEEIEVEIR